MCANSLAPRAVFAVLVTYLPDINVLKEVLRSLAGQVERLLVIDNSPSDFAGPLKGLVTHSTTHGAERIVLIANERNLGIAAAQNIGIRLAISSGASHILLVDQDTIFPPNATAELLQIETGLRSSGIRVGVVAPGFVNVHDRKTSPTFIDHVGFFIRKRRPRQDTVPISYAIASGMLVSADVFLDVGMMDESLFIDWVDIEWCLRAVSKGYRHYGTTHVVISHRLGDRTVRLLGQAIPVRAPIRHYYMVRNALLLALHSHVPNFQQRIALAIRALKYLIVYPFIARPFIANARMVCRGLLHGLTNRRGAY